MVRDIGFRINRSDSWDTRILVDASSATTSSSAGRRQLLAIDTGKLYGGRGDFLPVAEAIAQQIVHLGKRRDRHRLSPTASMTAQGSGGLFCWVRC
ncbi:hypothetical protein X748_04315 [Mesorhizobium sp. LNJC386A00]|nr:hypothetical protein X748_04315 [Mesorhizobium sp. LNJC386A00]